MYKLWCLFIDNVKWPNEPQMNLTVLYIGLECCKYDFLIISFAYVPCKVNAKTLCKVTSTWGDFAQSKLFKKMVGI